MGITRLLKTLQFDKLADKINAGQMLDRVNVKAAPSAIVGKFVYWIIFLLFIISATETLGWEVVSQEVSKVIAYLPQLFFAILFFVFGLYLAELLKKVIYSATSSIGLGGAKAISNVVFYIIVVFVSITALNQAGVNTDLITSNITLIFGGILLAFAIAYGFAARDILSNLLSSFYNKDRFKPGDKIRVDEVEGTIDKIDSLAITIKTAKGDKVIIPSKLLTQHIVELYN
jgi:small-conductance mechanosensitive channel